MLQVITLKVDTFLEQNSQTKSGVLNIYIDGANEVSFKIKSTAINLEILRNIQFNIKNRKTDLKYKNS